MAMDVSKSSDRDRNSTPTLCKTLDHLQPAAKPCARRRHSGPCGRKIAGIGRLIPAKPATEVTPEQGSLRTGFWSAPERSMWMSRWMNRPGWGGSQTRVCDTGPQVTPFSLFKCGSQRHSPIRTSWGESDARYLRLRPYQPPQSLRAVGQRPGNTTPAVAGRRRGAFSHLLGRRRLRDLRDRQPAGLSLSGLPAGSGRHPGCGLHRPHRAVLAGHHGEHPRPATARGEDSQPGR